MQSARPLTSSDEVSRCYAKSMGCGDLGVAFDIWEVMCGGWHYKDAR